MNLFIRLLGGDSKGNDDWIFKGIISQSGEMILRKKGTEFSSRKIKNDALSSDIPTVKMWLIKNSKNYESTVFFL